MASSTSSPNTVYSLVAALAHHIIPLENLIRDAYADDILTRNLNARVAPEILRVRGENTLKNALSYSHLTGRQYILAAENGNTLAQVESSTGNGRNATETVVGVVSFNVPMTLDAVQVIEKEEMIRVMKEKEKMVGPVEGANIQLEAALGAQRAKIMKKWFVEGRDIYVNTLAVHPTHTRRGIASRLVNEVVEVAKNMPGARIFLIASPAGLRVYLRAGFEVVEKIMLDFDRYGGEGGVGWASCMQWQLKA